MEVSPPSYRFGREIAGENASKQPEASSDIESATGDSMGTREETEGPALVEENGDTSLPYSLPLFRNIVEVAQPAWYISVVAAKAD